MTGIMYRLSRIKTKPIKNFLINRFISLYKVNTKEVKNSIPDGFDTFNAFFIRELVPDARKINLSMDAVSSPADGNLTIFGDIENHKLIQAKQHAYSLQNLLRQNTNTLKKFVKGKYATIYLAPNNYHRIHAPVDGIITKIHHIPGTLFSVNQNTVSRIPKLFVRNERIACYIKTQSTEIILLFIGALNVGSIYTPWTGETRPHGKGNLVDLKLKQGKSRELEKGDLLGWFNMGSTVITIYPEDSLSWNSNLKCNNNILVGDNLGQLTHEPINQ
tara:strand:- start:12002 stop:12823 length:822 start_codon:yes stop_codon:yes gene_type:complete